MFCQTTDGLQLYYEVRGNPEATETIVLLNGLTQSTVAWTFMAPFFNDYKLVLLDFIFQGNSAKTAEWRNFDRHAADVRNLLVEELGIKKFHLLGLSYGSLVAQHFAVIYPSNLMKLILVSTFAHKTNAYDIIEKKWWQALEKGGYGLMLDVMLPDVLSEDYFKNPIIPIEAMKQMRQGLNENKEAIFKLMRATKEREDYRVSLKRIKAPTLVIQGEHDSLLPVALAEEVTKNIPGAELVVIKKAGHTLNLERVPEVAAAVRKFLS